MNRPPVTIALLTLLTVALSTLFSPSVGAQVLASVIGTETSLGGGQWQYDYTVNNLLNPATYPGYNLYDMSFGLNNVTTTVKGVPNGWSYIQDATTVDTYSGFPGPPPNGTDIPPKGSLSGFSFQFDKQVGSIPFTALFINPNDPNNDLVYNGVTGIKPQFAFGKNLILNGDAEAGGPGPTTDSVVPVPYWSTTSSFTIHRYGDSYYLDYAEPGPSDRGDNFFYGGPGSAISTATQLVDVSDGAQLINGGKVSFDMSGWLGGWYGQNDNAVLTAEFLSGSGTSLGTSTIGPVLAVDRGSGSGLLNRDVSGLVPVNTEQIFLTLTMTRTNGSDNDGYADDLSLVLNAPVSSVPEPGAVAFLSALCFIVVWTSRRRFIRKVSKRNIYLSE